MIGQNNRYVIQLIKKLNNKNSIEKYKILKIKTKNL